MHQLYNCVYSNLFDCMCIYVYTSMSVFVFADMFIYIFISLCTVNIFITYRVSFLSVCTNFGFYERQSFPVALLHVHSNLTGTSSCTPTCWKDKQFMQKTFLSVLESWAGNIVSNLKKMCMCVFVCVCIHVFICLWLRAWRHILLLVNYPKQCGVGRKQWEGAEERWSRRFREEERKAKTEEWSFGSQGLIKHC